MSTTTCSVQVLAIPYTGVQTVVLVVLMTLLVEATPPLVWLSETSGSSISAVGEASRVTVGVTVGVIVDTTNLEVLGVTSPLVS